MPDTLIIAPSAVGDHPGRTRQQAEPVRVQLPVVSRAQPPRVERGKGRVHVNILGHCNWTFNDPLFRVLVFRARREFCKHGLGGIAALAAAIGLATFTDR